MEIGVVLNEKETKVIQELSLKLDLSMGGILKRGLAFVQIAELFPETWNKLVELEFGITGVDVEPTENKSER